MDEAHPDFLSSAPPVSSRQQKPAKKQRPHRLVTFPPKLYADPRHKANYDRAVKGWVSSHIGEGQLVLCSVPSSRKGDTDKQWVCPVLNCHKPLPRPGMTFNHLKEHPHLHGQQVSLFTGYYMPNAEDQYSDSAISFKSSGEQTIAAGNKRKRAAQSAEPRPEPELESTAEPELESAAEPEAQLGLESAAEPQPELQSAAGPQPELPPPAEPQPRPQWQSDGCSGSQQRSANSYQPIDYLAETAARQLEPDLQSKHSHLRKYQEPGHIVSGAVAHQLETVWQCKQNHRRSYQEPMQGLAEAARRSQEAELRESLHMEQTRCRELELKAQLTEAQSAAKLNEAKWMASEEKVQLMQHYADKHFEMFAHFSGALKNQLSIGAGPIGPQSS